MKKRIATTAEAKMNGNAVSAESGLQGLFVRGTNFIHYNPKDFQDTKRKSIRYRINGIVALTSFEKLVVTNIYDISLGGLSFLHGNDTDLTNSQLKMDILIFDIQSDFEYFISGVKGQLNSKELFLEKVSNVPIWRCHVEFLDLDGLQQSLLQTLCNLVRTTKVRFLSEQVPQITYDS